uniref:Uncharacterized protein n=1 Tax=Picea glauca TaxID=3330 RepID=A0A101M0A5_PICGL|nr:hypothetical protein ABT39_MTgene4627 [Picea glauca]QHR92489.1 hypothetical protein Q903MT_gene6535 [Picea sitchensis]
MSQSNGAATSSTSRSGRGSATAQSSSNHTAHRRNQLHTTQRHIRQGREMDKKGCPDSLKADKIKRRFIVRYKPSLTFITYTLNLTGS